ncbi:MAG: exopolyphosphatase [Tissierellia bacterium]|nr:exopolyphosphatase [Tissierellia bacterium]
MICGVIDIGSNTIRLSVYKVVGDSVKNLFSEKTTASLADFRKKKVLTEQGISRLVYVLSKLQALVDNFDDIEVVYPFATASLRNISNTEEVLGRVKEELGMEIEVLSAQEEARLSFIGAAANIEAVSSGVLTDIGGGSTEVVLFDGGQIKESASLDLGSLSSYRQYARDLFLTNEERKVMDCRLEDLLYKQDLDRGYYDLTCAVGGSARATLALYNDFYGEHPSNQLMDIDDLKILRQTVLDMPHQDKMDLILKTKPDRIHTLIPGMVILYRIAKYFHTEQISVSMTGVREGYIYSRVLGRGK